MSIMMIIGLALLVDGLLVALLAWAIWQGNRQVWQAEKELVMRLMSNE